MDLIGHRLGNYDIIEELGRGGMAVVYKAYQSSLNRYVAVKVLPSHLSMDQEFVARFQREARASAQLRHRNIVVIHDVGHDQGFHFIVMELLEGRTLKQLIEQEGALPVERASRIAEQVAEALDYAHERGLVHRDVKPANIFVGEDDHTTLTDFGIAKAASEAQQLTRTGILMGTPDYMSPEQAEGGEVDYRTDLYALGVVLYQMLAGQVPFRGTTPHAILHNVIYEPPTALRQLRPNLSPAIETMVMKAIDKRPERRYQSGSELAESLRKASTSKVQRLVVPAQPPPVDRGISPVVTRREPDERGKPQEQAPSRKPIVWILAALAVVLVGLVTALAIIIFGDGGAGETPLPPTTAVALADETAIPAGISASPTATVESAEPASATAVTDSPEPPTDTSEPPTFTPVAPTDTTEPPTDTPTPTATATPTTTPTPCAFLPQGAFAALWQAHRDELGCPLFQDPKLIQDAEQPFDNGHMFWRQDNDRVYVVHEQGASSGTWKSFGSIWSEGDPEYSCSASPPPGKIQPKRGFGAAWCNLGGASAAIGWGLQEEAGFGPGYGDPLVQQFENGFIFRDSDGLTKGLAYVFMRNTMTFVREPY